MGGTIATTQTSSKGPWVSPETSLSYLPSASLLSVLLSRVWSVLGLMRERLLLTPSTSPETPITLLRNLACLCHSVQHSVSGYLTRLSRLIQQEMKSAMLTTTQDLEAGMRTIARSRSQVWEVCGVKVAQADPSHHPDLAKGTRSGAQEHK